jgi:transposase
MANRLKMALVESILALHQRGWSRRRIARELGVDRATVRRHVAAARIPSNAANAPIGSDASEAPPDASASSGPDPPRVGPPSRCAPWRSVIEAKLGQGLTAQRIYQDLAAEHGFAGSYYSVRRFVQRIEHKTPLPFRRMECTPGEEAQVDFGTGAWLIDAHGKKRRTHVIRVVLSHSRKAYSEAVRRQTTDEFLRCLENAFTCFGGVPQKIVLDNLRAAVKTADWFDPELNPKVLAFARHYGTAFIPTRPRMPRHKGKVERGIGYVKENALKARTFASLDEQNAFLREWEESTADTRVHGTTRRQVGAYFLEVERPALRALPPERFPSFHEVRRTVHRDGHVEVDRAFYSVPPEYLAREVWVRWDARLVRIFNHRMEAIAVHTKRDAGRFSTHNQHIASEKINGVERGAAWLLGKVRSLGSHATRWAETVVQTRGVEGVRVVQGLLALANRHRPSDIERACEVAASYGAYHLRTVRALIKRQAPQQEMLPWISEHPLIRSLSEYQQWVHHAFQKEPAP